MKIQFEIDGKPAEFRWSNMNGAADLRVGNETVNLQSGLNPRSWFAVSLTRVWRTRCGDHDVEITKNRPRLASALRAAEYTVTVDDQIVTTAKGR